MNAFFAIGELCGVPRLPPILAFIAVVGIIDLIAATAIIAIVAIIVVIAVCCPASLLLLHENDYSLEGRAGSGARCERGRAHLSRPRRGWQFLSPVSAKARTMASRSAQFFLSGTSKQFDFVLNKYQEALQAKADSKNSKSEVLLKLDKW